MKDILKKSIFYSFAIALTSQLSINWFTANFKISIAVVILAACGLLMSNFPLIPVTFLSAIGVFSMRMIVYWITHGALDESFSLYAGDSFLSLLRTSSTSVYQTGLEHLSAAIHEKRNLTLGALILIRLLGKLYRASRTTGTQFPCASHAVRNLSGCCYAFLSHMACHVAL